MPSYVKTSAPALALAVLALSLGLSASAHALDVGVEIAQAVDQATLSREGQPLYARNCAVCHGAQGEGGGGPRLIGREFLQSAPAVIGQILNGYEERGMPPFKATLNDRQVAAIGTFVRNAWGNAWGVVLIDDVKNSR